MELMRPGWTGKLVDLELQGVREASTGEDVDVWGSEVMESGKRSREQDETRPGASGQQSWSSGGHVASQRCGHLGRSTLECEDWQQVYTRRIDK